MTHPDNDMEMSPSWSRAHDWKSCNRQKRFESSNLSISAKENPAEMRGFPLFMRAFMLFTLCAYCLFFAFFCVSMAQKKHRKISKNPPPRWRGYLFTTPSLTLRVPRTKGAFALCLRLERPHHNISAFHSLRNAGRQRRHLGQHSKSSPGAGELLGESRITFCGRGRPCQERKQP